tara:strand:- start:85 stop:480 length:396 start_codon:yes stop_codon:yes gene_type:complete
LEDLIRQNEARSQLPFLTLEVPKKAAERTAWTIERLGVGRIISESDAETSIHLAKGITLSLNELTWTLDAKGTIKQPLPIVPSDLRFLGDLIEPLDERRRSFQLQLDTWSPDIERLIRRLIEHKQFCDVNQ